MKTTKAPGPAPAPQYRCCIGGSYSLHASEAEAQVEARAWNEQIPRPFQRAEVTPDDPRRGWEDWVRSGDFDRYAEGE